MGKSAVDQMEYDRAIANARYKLEFILDNEKGLLRVRNGAEKLKAAQDFWDRIERIRSGASNETLTPGMISYIDSIYEKTWQGCGLPAMNVHVDKKRKGLRYG